jgi:Cd2+/Zn2+-exporting ATPase
MNMSSQREIEFTVEGMTCASCAVDIERALGRLDGVETAQVNYLMGKATIRFDPTLVDERRLVEETIARMGYRVRGTDQAEEDTESLWQRYEDYVFTGSTGLLLVLHVLADRLTIGPPWLATALGLAAIMIGAYPIFSTVFLSLRTRQINVDVLVAIAVVAATAVGHYFEAGTVLFIHLLGELLETITVGRAQRAIHGLMALIPETVRVKRNGGEEEIPVRAVRPGDIVVVRPGERIGVDGVIVAGQATVDQAPITGESVPVDKTAGDPVYSGTLNKAGAIEVEATKVGEETTVARIKALIHQAQQKKAPSQRLADRFAAWYVPVILGIAAVVYLVTGDVLRPITLLIVACPCALVLGPPTAVVAAIGNAARRGILIKSGAALEMTGRLDTVVFDKTGTLTQGQPQVVAVECFNCHPGHGVEDIVRCAAVSEKLSEHPLARAITQRAAEMGLAVPDPETFAMQQGQGVMARHEGLEIVLGSREHLRRSGLLISPEVEGYMMAREAQGETVLLMAHHDGQRAEICGAISVADTLRDDALSAVSELQTMGIRLAMHTGDNPRTARAIAGRLGIEHVMAELLPEEKVASIEALRAEGRRVAMVGDGINDAPALATADVGLAMGAIGTDVTVEAADVALMADDLSKVPQAIRLGRAVLGTIRQDIIFAVAFNAAMLLLASSGALSMVAGAVLHQVSSLAVALNSMRLFLYRPEGHG